MLPVYPSPLRLTRYLPVAEALMMHSAGWDTQSTS